jgi:hypothetical protein
MTEESMKNLGSAAAFLVAVGAMVGLILAQRNYQNSWLEPAKIQMTAPPAIPAPVNQGSVVLK